jgi:Velvet factor
VSPYRQNMVFNSHLTFLSDIDYGLFVINVDLWSADGLREVNLVRHSATSPAISSTVPTSYSQTQVINAPVYTNPPPVPTSHSNIARDPQYPYHLNQPTSNPSQNSQNSQNQPPYNPYPQQPQVNPYGQGNHQQGQAPGPPQSHYGQSQYQQQGPGYPGRPPSPGYNPPNRYQDPSNHHAYYHTGNSVHTITANAPRPGE